LKGSTKAVKEDEEWPPSLVRRAGRTRRNRRMKVRIARLVVTLSSVAMIAIAGGASLRGF
jgi:hypothetical protein